MSQRRWYQYSAEETAAIQRVDPRKGLTAAEVQDRQAEYGPNVLSEGKSISPLALFLNQFKDFMVLVLMGATLVSGLLGEYLDAITIVAIIIMNGILGFVQEFRAERSLRALKELSAPIAKVVRDGKRMEVLASELVPGDIVVFEGGDRIPADIRMLEASGLQIEESALTGESVPVHKRTDAIADEDVPLGDMKNMAFLGTMVTKGSGKGIVIGTGMQTEMGKIADLIQSTETMDTPLQHRLEQLGKILIGVAVALTVLVVVAGILHGQPSYGMFLAGVSLAVAAIPEGLPAIVTIALALGVQRMIKRKAIVRKLPSVETLGCASVICSDKTGTLTQNKMTVTHLWQGGQLLEVTGQGYEPVGQIMHGKQKVDIRENSGLRRLLQIAVSCNNAVLEQAVAPAGGEGKKQGKKKERQEWVVNGDPTEGALIVLGAKAGITASGLSGLYDRIAEFPFDSERKMMSVLLQHQGGRLLYAKGAPDMLLSRCTHILWEDKVIPFTDTLRQKVAAANEAMAKNALRVLGSAYREVKAGEVCEQEADAEKGLIFVGLTGMIDPPRKEVRQAISKCKAAGIKTVMITGDHQLTAEAIARQLGLLPEKGLVLNGRQLANMSDDELDEQVDQVYVYARVSPEHKLRIVKSLQRKGHVVAMTGDGVNDAPAIKSADIGIAMGITGTDVTKEASALVLSDDNFATIVAAIEEGRGIYENIRKFIRYLLASNVGEIMTMFLAMMMGMPLPLVPIQILWVNLVTDGLPALALGVDKAEDDLMKQKPRSPKENIFARRLGWKIISRGVMIGICTLAAFWIALNETNDLAKAQTVAFATLVMAQLIHVFDCRSSRSIFHRKLLENKALVFAVLSSVVLMLCVMYLEPLQPIFKTVDLALRDWMLVLVLAAVPTILFGIGSVLGGRRRPKRTLRYGGPAGSPVSR
ncbi:calcium-translocating P-type ATPase, SERCA-type [Xylanibacillus composti]|uniref:P-type Ca(2+) transporter n=1 Tax=Xylanibacillus composti TaxID=1572762 RepID=A0A8J4GYV4_9BACL|nr:calcium-translocating P-type ATPase, SERCA-type [Xylanibacillus composti]MDT9725586.1 calcium-translocating P-type ATPase, SERCA-type [Xylanibacillus composti]GIQ67679.1 calcium-translocating P-type ATPase, SERCA-type [Xylanibacillus composti]